MKKIIFFLFAGSLFFASCARDYNCQCTYTNTEDASDTYSTDSDLSNTKKGAQDNCDYLSGGLSYSGSDTYSVNCVLLEK